MKHRQILTWRISGAYPNHCGSRTAELSRVVTGSPTRNQPGAYLVHTPESSAGTFLASHLLRTLGQINRDSIFLAISIYIYICLANGCIVVRSFRVVVESRARDESGAYLAHIPKSSAGAFLAHTLLWRLGAANADPTFPAIS